MDLNAAKTVLLRTHIAALAQGHRANGMYLESGPGIGKSEGVEQTAEMLAIEISEPVGLVVFMMATISSVDVRGFMMPAKRADGLPGMDTYFSTPPWFPVRANTRVVEPDGNGGVVWHKAGTWPADRPMPRVGIEFLDEFAQAEDEVKKPAAELLLKGNVGTAELLVGWRVVAAGNRMSDRSGVMRELMFLVNRRCKLSIDASLPAWLNWANAQEPGKRPHYLSMSFAQKQPDLVFRAAVPAGSDPFCTPRTLCLMDKDLMALRSAEDIARDRLPLDSISREVAAGWIGAGEAAQFYTHMKYADELPDIADIEQDPSGAKLPANRDAQMVCGYMLAHGVSANNARQLMTYISRLNIEMQVLAVRAINANQAVAKHLLNTVEFTRWLGKHKDLLIASRS
jgi:hypothetical protein